MEELFFLIVGLIAIVICAFVFCFMIHCLDKEEIIIESANIEELKKIITSIDEIKEQINFNDKQILNLYAEQNDMWAEIEKLNNELDLLRDYVVKSDKLNIQKFSCISNELKKGK